MNQVKKWNLSDEIVSLSPKHHGRCDHCWPVMSSHSCPLSSKPLSFYLSVLLRCLSGLYLAASLLPICVAFKCLSQCREHTHFCCGQQLHLTLSLSCQYRQVRCSDRAVLLMLLLGTQGKVEQGKGKFAISKSLNDYCPTLLCHHSWASCLNGSQLHSPTPSRPGLADRGVRFQPFSPQRIRGAASLASDRSLFLSV